MRFPQICFCNGNYFFWQHDSVSVIEINSSQKKCLGSEKKKPINRKHMNIFLTALVGQSSQGRTPARPRDKRDKIAILLWNSTEKGRFVPGTGPNLFRGGVPCVPGTVPVCPGHRPAQNVYVYWFCFLPECLSVMILDITVTQPKSSYSKRILCNDRIRFCFLHSGGSLKISRVSKFSRISRKWTFLKRPFSKRPVFPIPIFLFRSSFGNHFVTFL